MGNMTASLMNFKRDYTSIEKTIYDNTNQNFDMKDQEKLINISEYDE